jgi:hypothetical protein
LIDQYVAVERDLICNRRSAALRRLPPIAAAAVRAGEGGEAAPQREEPENHHFT